MGKKRPPLQVALNQWREYASSDPAALIKQLDEGRASDLLRALIEALAPRGTLNTAEPGLRLQVLHMLERRCLELCCDAPTDLLRQLYEVIRDRAAAPRDPPPTAARMQLAGLLTLTQLLVKLDMPQRDARLVKVHVEMLFKMVEASGPYATASTDMRRTAATCLRLMEEGAPTLLLAGSKQLLELSRREAGPAAESYALLAATVVSHGAARCLDGQRCSGEGGVQQEGRADQRVLSAAAEGARQGSGALHTMLSPIDVRALVLGGGSGSDSGCVTPSGARDISPHGTLDATHQAMTTFASGCTATSSEGFNSPKVPDSPRGVASVVETASTCNNSGRSAAMAARHAMLSRHASIASSEISGSVQLDGGTLQLLLSPDGRGLRHFRVPQHLHWPDALGQDAACVCIAPEALPDLRQACCDFLAALPLLASVEGVACVTTALPPIMRLAQLPSDQLQAQLDVLLHSGQTLMLQAVLRLHSEVPEAFVEWQGRLVDSVLDMINGPTPIDHRVVAATWCLVQHHAQMHSQQASLFAGSSWRQLMPRSDDPPQLLSLKVKALSACLAVGIGRADEICAQVFAWDGFWQRSPTDQQQRLATYALRMLATAAVSYASASAAHVAAARSSTALSGRGEVASEAPATPHYVKACLVSACLQLLATRPQYLPAVEAFLANCGNCCADIQHTMLNAMDALLSAAVTGTFTSLQPRSSSPVRPKQRALAAGVGNAQTSITNVLQSMAKTVSQKLAAAGVGASAAGEADSQQQKAEGWSVVASRVQSSAATADALPLHRVAPQPPSLMQSWEAAEAWLWDSRTWAVMSEAMMAHDPMAYRSLMLRLAQSGASVLPMGTLRLLAAYATQYQGEQPGHELSAKEAGNCVLAICQAAAMTHLLVGPAGAPQGAPLAGRGRTCTHGAAAEGSSAQGVPQQLHSATAGPDAGSTEGAGTPQWTQQQEEIAAAMQAVLAALTSHSPTDSVRRRAQGFLDLLANPSAWDLRLRMGTMAKMLGGYFSDAVSIASYL